MAARAFLLALALGGARAQDVEIEAVPDVEVVQRPQLLYSSISPKLRIQGKGFGKVAGDVHAAFIPPLEKKGKRFYNLTVTDTVLTIGLKKGFQWPQSSTGETSTLFLQSLVVDAHGSQNQLPNPVPVASIIPPPSVVRGEDKLVYMTGTNRFLINGTGFREGSMSLTFDPPLIRDVDYVLAVRSPTGAGALRIDPKFGGVIVAEVQVDLGGHGVIASPSPQTLLYQNAPSLVIKGSGFAHVNEVANFGSPRLRWGNGLLGRGVNYTVSTFDDNKVELVLKPGSVWRRNGANLPAPLTLLAADVGSGLVAMGATEARKGVRVATLWITGVGFTRPGSVVGGFGGEMKLDFEPELKVGQDYTLTVFNRTHLLVRLREGRAWAAAPGPLYVVGCDAGAGPYEAFKPAAVAHILPDADSHPSGVEVTRTNSQVLYQTPAIRHLEIHGSSLSMEAKLVFSPPLYKNVDYKVLRATSDLMVLGLLAGKTWRQTAGHLMLMSIDTGDGAVEMAHGTGIVVADVAANPTVATSTARITASTTRRLSIYGTGFSIDGTELTLEPTSRSAYDVEAVYERSDEREDTDEFDQYDYGYMYDDSYGYYGDDAAMPACIAGTDCTDCGGPLEFMAEDDDADADAGDWDDDEWFDDDTEEWWDDDYDFGEKWDGFEDDEKDGDGPIGIISSVQPSKKPNKRHMTKEQREALKHGSGGFFDVAAHPAAAAGAALAALVLAAVGCLSFCKKEEGLPTENPCLGGKRKQAQA
ncbi:hypothetical protein JL721_7218 [Aureococcus anophagefferens]|nr:hypothetical protein JL721_7218 [Aureococcus anophagefferens]